LVVLDWLNELPAATQGVRRKSALEMSAVVFACICVGIFLGAALPGHNMADDTKDVVRLGTGLIGTIGALVLGLLIASAKESYDTKTGRVRQMTANIVLLDQLLAQYGPEAKASRENLPRAIPPMIERIWRENAGTTPKAAPFEVATTAEATVAKLLELSPQNDAQSSLKARAVQASTDMAQTRLLLYTQSDNAVPLPFLGVLVFWLTILFASFSLFARPNAIVIASLLVFALSASAAIFLILELSEPFTGLMSIPSEPVRHALAPLAP
jgi:Protein of unknown function (DUF4239)